MLSRLFGWLPIILLNISACIIVVQLLLASLLTSLSWMIWIAFRSNPSTKMVLWLLRTANSLLICRPMPLLVSPAPFILATSVKLIYVYLGILDWSKSWALSRGRLSPNIFGKRLLSTMARLLLIPLVTCSSWWSSNGTMPVDVLAWDWSRALVYVRVQ